MRVGTAWRLTVLASLALLLSGQLCMLTTCLPRLIQRHPGVADACRRAAVTRTNAGAGGVAHGRTSVMPRSLGQSQVGTSAA